MNKKEFLKSLDKVYCRLGTTKYGVGVIAIRDIPKGIDLFKGSLLTRFVAIKPEELKRQPDEIKLLIKDFCPLQEEKYYCPATGMNTIDISYYLNHSKNPNMTTDEGEDFITSRDIKKGEELTVDYETYDDVGL